MAHRKLLLSRQSAPFYSGSQNPVETGKDASCCPPEIELASYVDCLATEEEAKSLEAHLSICARCREAVAGLREAVATSSDELPADTLERIQSVVSAALEKDAQARRALRARSCKHSDPRRFGWLFSNHSTGLRYAAAVVLLLLLGFTGLSMRGRAPLSMAQRVFHNARTPVTQSRFSSTPNQSLRLVANIPLDDVLTHLRSKVRFPQAAECNNKQQEAEEAALIKQLEQADRDRLAGRFQEALNGYGRVKMMTFELDQAHRPTWTCCCTLKNYVTEVYIPFCQGGCYLGLKDYRKAKEKLETVTQRLSGVDDGKGQTGYVECSCEECKCLGQQAQELIAYCEDRLKQQG